MYKIISSSSEIRQMQHHDETFHIDACFDFLSEQQHAHVRHVKMHLMCVALIDDLQHGPLVFLMKMTRYTCCQDGQLFLCVRVDQRIRELHYI